MRNQIQVPETTTSFSIERNDFVNKNSLVKLNVSVEYSKNRNEFVTLLISVDMDNFIASFIENDAIKMFRAKGLSRFVNMAFKLDEAVKYAASEYISEMQFMRLKQDA